MYLSHSLHVGLRRYLTLLDLMFLILSTVGSPVVQYKVILNMQLYDLYIKKTGLDPTLCFSFKPTSNLPYISKMLEKVVYIQLLLFLEENSITELSGFKPLHTSESALLMLSNFCPQTLFVVCCFGTVRFSTAFSTVDHSNLLLQELCGH